jgi:hypothetical protein
MKVFSYCSGACFNRSGGAIAMVDDQDLPTKFDFRLIRSSVPGLGGRGEVLLWLTIVGALEALSHPQRKDVERNGNHRNDVPLLLIYLNIGRGIM